MQPLRPAVSRGNESYNTNSSIASLLTVVCVCRVLVLAMATIRGQCLFRSELPIVWLLCEGSDYSRAASI